METQPQKSHNILLIDDDEEFCTLMTDYLGMHSFSIDSAYTGQAGIEASNAKHYDIILLDMLLPDISGVDVLRCLRRKTGIPVIILSAHNEETDRIVTLEIGADDYVPKTFSARELLARIRVVLRRTASSTDLSSGADESVQNKQEASDNILNIRGITINPYTMEASVAGRPLGLTVVEFQLLHRMAKEPGRIFSRDDLLNLFAEKEWSKLDRSVDVHISSLRRKLEDDARCPRYLKTIRGIGYTFLRDDGSCV